MTNDLKRRQAAAENLTQRMVEFLVDFEPMEKISVGDMKTIARFASSFAFDEFSKEGNE